jgi:hypothetical protein
MSAILTPPAQSKRRLGSKDAAGDHQWTPTQARRLAGIAKEAPSKSGIFERVYAGKASMRLCIKAFCLECVGLDVAAVRECTATACPLWRRRPYQRGPAA